MTTEVKCCVGNPVKIECLFDMPCDVPFILAHRYGKDNGPLWVKTSGGLQTCRIRCVSAGDSWAVGEVTNTDGTTR